MIAAISTARAKAHELGLLTRRELPKPFYLDPSSTAVYGRCRTNKGASNLLLARRLAAAIFPLLSEPAR